MKIKNIFIIILIILFSAGCGEDELDLFPMTKITEGTFYQNETQIQQAVDDIYRQLGQFYNGGGLPDIYGELASDNTYIEFTGGATTFSEQITDFWIQTNNGDIQGVWENGYNSIFICNNVLYQLENTDVEIESTKLNIMKGQVLLIRSLIYFNMVRAWGAIPYIDTKISPSDAYEYLRVAPSEIYQSIINDLKFCKQTLPSSYSGDNVGRVTKYAASAILAKIYLTNGNTADAKTELEFIINSNQYSLDANNDGAINTADYLHLFAPDTKNCKASILEAQYKGGENAMNSNHQRLYTPYHWAFHLPGVSTTYRGGGMNTPTDDLEEEFEENDPRKETSIYPGYINLDTDVFVEYPFTMKFFDPNWEYEGQNFEIIRYADILLMYSEVTNDPQYLNQVRARVGMPVFNSDGYPSDKFPTLSLAIEHERRIELCFEFHRFFDLVRTGRALEIMQSKGYDIEQTELLFPIPLRAIDVNPELAQNPGY